MTNEIAIFCIGYVAGIITMCAFLLGRKSLSHLDGIRTNSDRVKDSAEKLDSVSAGIADSEAGIASAITILENAGKRTKEKNDSV